MSFPNDAADLVRNLEDSIREFDVGRLATLMPRATARGRGVQLSYRFTNNSTLNYEDPVETLMQGPPLCVMIESIRTARENLTGARIHELLKVTLVGGDPNAVFTVNESWPARADRRPNSMQCNAMSWALWGEHDVPVNFENLKCCITALVELKADVTLPYILIATPRPNIFHGLSLPYVAMKFAGSLKSAQILLDKGARFTTTDPPPFVTAISKFSAENAVNFFYDNYIAKKITVNLDGGDMMGSTALHLFIYDPRQKTEDAAVTLLTRILCMGFSPMTTDRNGTTALESASVRIHTAVSKAIYDRLLLATTRPLAVVAAGVVGRLPAEVGDLVLKHTGYRVSSTEVKAALDRVRTILKKNDGAAADD